MTTRTFDSALAQPPSKFHPSYLFGLLLLLGLSASCAELGLFESEADVGKPAKPGRAVFDPAAKSYAIAGGGENMWFTNDSFHFLWKRVSGDFTLQAAID